MSDIADKASEREQELLQEAMYQQQKRGQHSGDSAHECCSCGEQIPEDRRKALPGVQTCIGCQKLIEKGQLK